MASFSLNNLNGSNGFRIGLSDLYDNRPLGSVSNAGDVNGDGIDDVIIGAPGVGAAGSSYVVFGSVGWTAAPINPEALDGTNGFRIDGIDYADALGWSVSSAGDVNGDGVDDVIIGAPRANANGNEWAGESYVVFGSVNWSTAVINLADLDGMNGFRIDGLAEYDFSGMSVSSAGDVNGDGVGDIIIGSQESTNYWEDAGKSYVVFGSVDWNAEEVDVANLDGTNGFSIVGVGELSGGGHSVSSAGDFNGDGINDVIIGEPNDISRTGESYVVFGSMGWGEGSVNLSALDGSNGFRIDGTVENGSSGSSVSSAGDVNGDGIDDVIIGAPGVGAAGSSYVVFGSVDWTAASINPEALDGTNGFRVDGVEANDQSGISVSSAGDVNGDGVDDVIIGSTFGGRAVLSGASYVVFGSVGWTAASVDLADLNGTDGFAIFDIEAGEYSGHTVSSAGDVNGDGYADLLIGTNSTITSLVGSDVSYSYSGEAYVLFGNAALGLNAPTGSVIVSGDATEGATLTADASTVADADGLGTLNYQWQRDGVNITGATAAIYTLTQADVGLAIRAVVSYTDLWGNAESVASAATGTIGNVNDAPTGAVTISGLAEEGRTLSANVSALSDEDGLGLLNYQWQRGGVDIIGATSSSYVLTQADVGSQMTVVVSYEDSFGTQESVTSNATGAVSNVNDVPTGAVTISGTVAEDQVLTATNTLADEDGIGTLSNQWQRGGQDILGATSDTYTLTQADVGAGIRVVVSYEDGFGAAESVASATTGPVENVNDAPTGSVNASGFPIEGRVLTATNSLGDIDGLGEISYQWQADGEDIIGATEATYLLAQADVGKFIAVVASYTDGFGALETVISDATPEIRNINDLPTGVVVVNGTPAESATLTADTSALSDEDGLGEYSYQWQRDGSDITGATGPTYTLTQTDVGAAVRVVVSYTDDQGTAETVTSTDVMDIVNVNDSPTGSVVILGDAVVSGTLTVSTGSLADEDGLGFFSYQWLRDESPLEGATAETHTLTPEDVGTAISVNVSYTDGYGADEVVSSAATNPVASSIDEFTSIVTTTLLDRFGQVVTDGAVAVREMDGGPEVFVREVSDDTATGTVFEIVVQPSTDISALDFELYDNAGLVDFQVSQALADWTTQTNSSVTDQVIFSGFGAPDGSLALPAGQETVVGRFETASDVDFDLAGIFLNGTSAEAISVQDVALDAQQNNVFTHSVANGADAQVAADRALDVASENAIGAFDALQALRLAVGLTKSDGTAEWHDYFAADINQDGRVGADDALNILKFAVGLTDGPSADWVFVDGNADYSDVTRQNSGYSEGILQTDVTADTSVNLIGILVGDVDGSYALTAI